MRHILDTVLLLQQFFPTGSVEVTSVQPTLALRGIIPPCYLDCRCPPSGSSKQSWSGSSEFEEFSCRCMNNGIQHHLKESILQKIGEKPGKNCFRLLKQNSNLNMLIFAQDFFLGGTARLPFGVLLARHQSHRVEKDPSPTWPSWMFGKLKADDVPDGLSRDHRRTGCKTLLMKQPKILTDLQGEFFFLKLFM